METHYSLFALLDDTYGCVRTIVVWKRHFPCMTLLNPYLLRENHSGMETRMDRLLLCQSYELRENHSGMETNNSLVFLFLILVA